MKIPINTARVASVFRRVGDAADAIGRAADAISSAGVVAAKGGPALHLWGSAAWADLLRRFTGR